MTLSNPTGGATLTTPNTAVLTIINNDITDVRGIYVLSDSSFLTLTACSYLNNGTFDTNGTINVAQNNRSFSGAVIASFVSNYAVELTGALSGTVNPGGQLNNGTFRFSSNRILTTVAKGNGTFTGSFADVTLTTQIVGRVTSGDTCQITGTLTGIR